MSVSLTHVQAALQNHLTSGGSGPLTLNVLHKTDALISQLKALSHTKPLSVEVLKALPNGRAEVLTNGCDLTVANQYICTHENSISFPSPYRCILKQYVLRLRY